MFHRASQALRDARGGTAPDWGRAIAHNQRLWSSVLRTLRDPSNDLPGALRNTLISLGLSVQQEMEAPAPDLAFLLAVNQTVVASLAARA